MTLSDLQELCLRHTEGDLEYSARRAFMQADDVELVMTRVDPKTGEDVSTTRWTFKTAAKAAKGMGWTKEDEQ